MLDLKKLQWDKVDDLSPLREKLAAYRSRIRLILPKLAAAHPEVILLAGMFQHYQRMKVFSYMPPPEKTVPLADGRGQRERGLTKSQRVLIPA